MNRELITSGQKNRINGGIVITGGTALLANIVELAEQIFDLQVRIGYPVGVRGAVEKINTPRCTTGVGLVLQGRKKQMVQLSGDLSMIGKFRGWVKKIM